MQLFKAQTRPANSPGAVTSPLTAPATGPAERLTLAGLAVAGLFLRTINLPALALFADEAIHIRGGLDAQSGKFNSEGLFSLVHTSRVLHGWITGAIYYLFNNTNLTILGRGFSALCGVVTLL